MIPKFRAWLKKEQKMDNEIDHISRKAGASQNVLN